MNTTNTTPEKIEAPAAEMLREVREMAAEVEQMRAELGGRSLGDVLAQWLLAQYAQVMRRAARDAGGQMPPDLLRKMTNDVVALRKGDQRARRLELLQERVEIERTKTREGREKDFVEWRKLRRHEEKPPLTPEERDRKMRAVFGLR